MSNRATRVSHKRYRYQLFTTLTVNIISFCHGIAIGWLAPMLSKMQSSNSPIDFPVSITDASWIGSLIGIGSLFGSVTFGLLVDRIGRKPCIYLLAVPHILHWIFIYFAASVEFLFTARVMGGITGGGVFLIIPIFIGEISDPSVRGRFASIFMLSLNIGTLLGFIVASHLPYHLIPYPMIVMPLLYLILTLYFPESPQYLLRNARDANAKTSMKFYRNCPKGEEVTAEMVNVEEEFHELKRIVTKEEKAYSTKDFCTEPSLRAIFLALTLAAFNQFSGQYALVNYMSTVFQLSGAKTDHNTSTIIVGVAQIFGACFAIRLIDRHGRKMLMIISYTGMSIGMAAFGLFAQQAPNLESSNWNWLPLLIMSFIIFIANMGFVSITSVILVEILPPKIRSRASFLCGCCTSVMIFASLKVFPILIESIGLPVTMWICSLISVLGVVFVWIFLPETKGKPMDDDDDYK